MSSSGSKCSFVSRKYRPSVSVYPAANRLEWELLRNGYQGISVTIDEDTRQEPGVFVKNRNRDFLFDLVLYLSIMFLVREVYFSSVGFMVNGVHD